MSILAAEEKQPLLDAPRISSNIEREVTNYHYDNNIEENISFVAILVIDAFGRFPISSTCLSYRGGFSGLGKILMASDFIVKTGENMMIYTKIIQLVKRLFTQARTGSEKVIEITKVVGSVAISVVIQVPFAYLSFREQKPGWAASSAVYLNSFSSMYNMMTGVNQISENIQYRVPYTKDILRLRDKLLARLDRYIQRVESEGRIIISCDSLSGFFESLLSNDDYLPAIEQRSLPSKGVRIAGGTISVATTLPLAYVVTKQAIASLFKNKIGQYAGASIQTFIDLINNERLSFDGFSSLCNSFKNLFRFRSTLGYTHFRKTRLAFDALSLLIIPFSYGVTNGMCDLFETAVGPSLYTTIFRVAAIGAATLLNVVTMDELSEELTLRVHSKLNNYRDVIEHYKRLLVLQRSLNTSAIKELELFINKMSESDSFLDLRNRILNPGSLEIFNRNMACYTRTT